ncbi:MULTISPECIES: terminase small subunit [Pelosinus]|uniref:Terminase small subunit n=1 Tax=Pelosinus fermentans B4 TaxID=1149862 RepID=I9LJL9_9FIRM|nr:MULTISPECIES: terminase small subunit [Pelosinus]EIW20724.1 Terminase small subunit [Pelosinus fermentans B4]EIW25431.1 Terminase small subunit [Pelosinus fermentans A11]OAM93691.1 Terminase small subunit [Pelosinus fermentans DSM 17108]SDQ86740.1 phage terminase small subunit [Pelosinus fermentans]
MKNRGGGVAQSHELAQRDYILGMKYREIADKYKVSIDTVKSWKVRYKWERDKTLRKTAHTAHKNKNVCTQEKEVQEPSEELTDKEQLFCYYYVRCWNATQASLKSGYTANKSSATVQGSRLLKTERVEKEVARLKTLLIQEIHISALDVLQQYINIAFADIGDYVTFGKKEVPIIGMFGPVTDPETGEEMTQMVNYVDLNEHSLVDTSVIAEVKQGRDGVSIKLADKMKALEKLEIYFDLLPDKFQRKLAEEKIDIERQKLEIARTKVGDDEQEENNDDNFINALSGKVSEVWPDEKK